MPVVGAKGFTFAKVKPLLQPGWQSSPITLQYLRCLLAPPGHNALQAPPGLVGFYALWV